LDIILIILIQKVKVMWNLSSSDHVWNASPYQGGYPFPYQPQGWGLGGEILASSLAMGQDLNGAYQRVGKKRRRSTNASQRKAANIRERRRMLSLNDSFDRLRTQV
jgi:hypothetical protein